MTREETRSLKAVSYAVYFTDEDQEVTITFADYDEAAQKAQEMANEGHEVYMAYYDDDGDEVFYDTFEPESEEVSK
jgi:hypothetical protein